MIKLEEYKARRQKIANIMPENSIAIIFAASEILRNGDATYKFRQSSDFYYLTGFNEPDAVLIINSGTEGETVLFNKPKNPLEEQWCGRRLGQDDAPEKLGVTRAYSIDSLAEQLNLLLSNKDAIYYDVSQNQNWDTHIFKSVTQLKNKARSGVSAPSTFCDIKPILSEMRLFKSEAEICLMRKAAAISVNAHKHAMKKVKSLQNESELESELLYQLNLHGCKSVAYEPIVASGNNACVLHYVENNQQLNPNDLILIDAGGEFENYAADITRVFPKNGKYTQEQKQIYDLVLKAQKAAIALVKPGCPWNTIQEKVVNVLTKGLIDLDILHGNATDLVEAEAYRPFYMHGAGHWLGLDVHDCGQYKVNGEWRNLEPGMVLTVEPGLYIMPGLENVDKRWWGIGVRIEDDILVTEDGYENLSADLMVDIAEIEAYMRG
ncbi:MAG: Xaa-Pro aminopeptidase [Legionellaceae bacterium]|nr:Xaa-Pro aminopeptidase [Legionellaceae bacterium]